MRPDEGADLSAWAAWVHYWFEPLRAGLTAAVITIAAGVKVIYGLTKRIASLEDNDKSQNTDIAALKFALGEESKRVCAMIERVEARLETRLIEISTEQKETRETLITYFRELALLNGKDRK